MEMWADNSPLLNAFDSFLLSLSYPSTFCFWWLLSCMGEVGDTKPLLLF